MARHPSGAGSAKDPQGRRHEPAAEVDEHADVAEDDLAAADLDEADLDDADLDDADLDGDAEDDLDELAEEEIGDDDPGQEEVRPARTDALWTEVRVEPVEIALPSGVGYTLRAYRQSTEVAEPEIDESDDDFVSLRQSRMDEADEDDIEIDEAELTRAALAAGRSPRRSGRRDDDDLEDDVIEDSDDLDTDDLDSDDLDDELAEDEEPDEEATAEPEEVPVFLARRGKLLLFRSAEGLVGYVRGADDHDLAQLDTWPRLRERIEPADVVPLDEDRYELDLVVKNLRGGHDAWDPALIIQAGEIARDLAYALRLRPVITALAPGSPLDDLDEGLRTVEEGGFRALFARRRVRKIDPQTTAALGWRTVIGKISAAVDWRN